MAPSSSPAICANGLQTQVQKTLYIEPGSPWENGYCESFNSKLRDEFLNGEIFYSMKEIRILAERWRVHYNTIRPHTSLGYRPPAPESVAGRNENRVWRSGKQTALPTSPHPRRRLLDHKKSCATLTLHGTKDRADQGDWPVPFRNANCFRATRVMWPALAALTVTSIAHAQGTMDFSGATTLMTTFKTFAIFAGAVICFGGLIFAGIRMMSGRFQDAIPGLFGALFGAGVLGWGAGWIGLATRGRSPL